MKKKAILLIHGMGKNTAPTAEKPGSFGQQFIDATTATLQQFAKHKTDKLENFFDIHEFNYDDWFDQMRKEMANNAKAMKNRLDAIGGIAGVPVPPNLVTTLVDLEAKFGDDTFFYTHWLDVIFYGTMLGGAVRVKAGLKIAELVEKYSGENVHIVAHSLGTAVAHDTLHLLYRPESDPDNEIPDLDIVNHKLGSIWMFANVSRLVNSVTRLTNPLGSVVKPGDDGCTAALFNIHHTLDPFTWLAEFDPQNDGHWVPGNIYTSDYKDIVTDLVVEANTHSFPQYLQDPRGVEVLLPFLLFTDFKATFVELQAAAEARSKLSLEGAFASLQDSLKDALKTPHDIAGWRDFLTTARKFGDAVKLLKGSL